MNIFNFRQLISMAGCLALLCLPNFAVAQEDTAPDESRAAAEEAKAAAEEAKAAAEEAIAAAEKAMAALDAQKAKTGKTTETEDKADADKNVTLGDVFTRADTGAPNAMVQGIDGGTLAGTHGIQWPYFTKSTIGVSGYIWADASRGKGESTKEDGDPTEERWLYQGRGVLRVSPTYIASHNFFIQGQIELVADKNMNKDLSQPDAGWTDDLWIKVGQWGKKYNNWDFQAGRMEAWPLFHLGMGLDLNTLERKGAKVGNSIPPEFYGVTYTWGRPTSEIGNMALHYYPTDWLRMETIFQVGSFGLLNSKAGRGSAILDLGVTKLRGGAEYKKVTSFVEGNENDEVYRGAGGALQFVFAPWVEFGGHGAYARTDFIDGLGADNPGKSNDTWAVGSFLNVNPLATVGAGKYLTIGGGINYTNVVDLLEDNDDQLPGEFSHLQTFGAIQYRLFGQLSIKGVFSYAKGEFHAVNAPEHETKLLSGRLRFQYNF